MLKSQAESQNETIQAVVLHCTHVGQLTARLVQPKGNIQDSQKKAF
jgi:hypothetical protein